jgi:hypothetical protein
MGSINSTDTLSREVIHIQGRTERMAHYLEWCVIQNSLFYFVNFPFNIFGTALTMGN